MSDDPAPEDLPALPGADELAAVVVAGHRGDERTARAGLTSGQPAVRVAALGALDRLGSLTSDDVNAALTDVDRRVRARACELGATYPGVALLRALHDPEPLVMEVAAWACGECWAGAAHTDGLDAIVERLVELGGDADDQLVREAAIAALGSIGDPRGRDVTLAAARTDRPAVRRRAVVALAAYPGDDVVAAIRAATDDRDWQVRAAAEDLLRAIR